MSVALRVTPVSSFIFGCLYNGGELHARTGFQKNFRFIYNNDILRQSRLRFVANQKLRLLKSSQVHKLCKWRDGFMSSVGARFCAASSFNDSVGDFEDRRRVKGVKKEAASDDGSNTNTGNFGSNGNGNSDRRGGGDNGGTGSGGLGESADWEGIIWFCWRIYKAWSYCTAKLSSSIVARSGVGDIHDNTKGLAKKVEDPNLERRERLEPLARAIFEPLLVVLFVPCLTIALAVCAALCAGVLLFGCVVAVVIFILRSLWS